MDSPRPGTGSSVVQLRNRCATAGLVLGPHPAYLALDVARPGRVKVPDERALYCPDCAEDNA